MSKLHARKSGGRKGQIQATLSVIFMFIIGKEDCFFVLYHLLCCLCCHLWEPTLRTIVLEGCICCHPLWTEPLLRISATWGECTLAKVQMHPWSCSLRFSHSLVTSKELDVYCLCGDQFADRNLLILASFLFGIEWLMRATLLRPCNINILFPFAFETHL